MNNDIERGAFELLRSLRGDYNCGCGHPKCSKEATQQEIDKVLAAQPEPSSGVPDGFKLVPIEPTLEMERCAEDYWIERRFNQFSSDPRTWKGVYQSMLAAAPDVESRPLPVNRYGVDCDYFTKKLEILIRDMDNYTQAELARSLGRLAMTADSETMQEPEFIAAPAVQGEPECGCCGQRVKCDDDCDAVVIGGNKPAPDVAGLVEALEQCITSMLDSGYRADAVVIRAARTALERQSVEGEDRDARN